MISRAKWIKTGFNLYHNCLSAHKLPSCRFVPTCSKYAEEALLSKGIVKGLMLTFTRILRCQPLSASGYDPVPGREEDN